MEEEVKEQKILQQLFDVLDGRLPSMTKYERKDYNEFGEKLESLKRDKHHILKVVKKKFLIFLFYFFRHI